jgi:hypothetical protein
MNTMRSMLEGAVAQESMGWSYNSSLLYQESMYKFKQVNSAWIVV